MNKKELKLIESLTGLVVSGSLLMLFISIWLPTTLLVIKGLITTVLLFVLAVILKKATEV